MESQLECGHDMHWHHIRTQLAVSLHRVVAEEMMSTPLEEAPTLSRWWTNSAGVITDFRGPWDPLIYVHNLLYESGMYLDQSCALGWFAFSALSFLLVPTQQLYIEAARRFVYLLELGLGIFEITNSGWPVWLLLELVVLRARLERLQLEGWPVTAAALTSWDNATLEGLEMRRFQLSIASIHGAIADSLAEVRLLKQGAFFRELEHDMLRKAGRHLTQVASMNLGQQVYMLAAALPIWRLLALVQRRRIFLGGCPAGSLLIHTRRVGTGRAAVPSVRMCVRPGSRFPIDRFLIEVGTLPDCVQLVQAVGPPDTPGEDLAVDVGANVGAKNRNKT
eukprot:gnl/TRDRNA2_/TRDRNA2_144072_c0_seq3.p1 gnl/TRDRNA2_/TRDRNA2_144072_c0~~gnl/TRDRNA2_/TRDRNA2_144072_c0_seq3.p1  ORF type:complete len:335 (+),score=29.06 gnl/TRDRNA2_/TRDRNA2_144072_c0_seq3:86-1090(+)